MSEHSVPGVAIAYGKGDKVVWRGDFGRSDVKGRAVDADTRFNIGSCSKMLTACLVLKLSEEKKLDLDKPVNQYLRSWKLKGEHAELVTVRNVLGHTAGLSQSGCIGVYRLGQTMPSAVETLDGYPGTQNEPLTIMEKPGTAHRYSSGGYVLLQVLVEDVTGRPFAELMRNKVFQPLGMTKTGLDAATASVATPFNVEGNAFEPPFVYPGEASGGVYTTADDLAKFLLEVLQGTKVLSRETWDIAALPVEGSQGASGLGFQLIPLCKPPFVGHQGANDGWRALCLIDHPTKSVFVMLSNSDAAGKVTGPVVEDWAKKNGITLVH